MILAWLSLASQILWMRYETNNDSRFWKITLGNAHLGFWRYYRDSFLRKRTTWNDRQFIHLRSNGNAFAVTILEENQLEISDRFAGRLPDSEDQWIGIETETLITGAPLIKGGLAYFDCRVTKAIPVGSNTLFLAEVIATRENPNGQPLLYYNRNYQNLVKLQRP